MNKTKLPGWSTGSPTDIPEHSGMGNSTLYLCSSCCQIFDSLEVVTSHQLTCQTLGAKEETVSIAPPASPAESSGVPLPSPNGPPQHQPRAQNTDLSVADLYPLNDNRATGGPGNSRLHLGSVLFKSNVPQTQKTQIQNSSVPLVRYQCRECEVLFESLGLWQKHSMLGNCSTAESDPGDQEVDADCRPEIGDETGREGWSDGWIDTKVEVNVDEEREDVVDQGGGPEDTRDSESLLESKTNLHSQNALPTAPTRTSLVACGSSPAASSSGQIFFCAACGSGFNTEPLLVLHRTATHGLVGALHHCEVCGETFMNTTKYLYHRKQHRTDLSKPGPLIQPGRTNAAWSGGAKPLNRPPVTLTTTTAGPDPAGRYEEGMKTGRVAADADEPKSPTFFRYKCPDCPHCFRTHSQVPVHRYSHTGKHPFTCSVCGDHFFHKSRLRLHALTHQGVVDTGQVAKGTPRSRGGVRGRWREDAGLLECEFCRHRCVTEEGLVLHRLSHTGQTPQRCPVTPCRRRYATAAALQEHLIAHRPAPGHTVAAAHLPKPRPFHCHHCGKDFTTGSSLSVHIRVHTGERPFQCAQCGKRFRQIPHLRDHERLHSGERPFVCGVCGKCFVLAARLTEHARIHSGEKPFSCPACHRAFRSLSNLGKHRKTQRCRPPGLTSAPRVKGQGATDHVEGQTGIRAILLLQPQTVSREGCPLLPLQSSTPLVFSRPSVAMGDEQGGAQDVGVLEHANEVIVEQAAE
ncbi:hypothetical protein DPEC_G00200950 [Dallia pectoralis]|uniref:Uncharacterized protein n=1 Tax=Dallia pectoralis TaxID=75939 RepID=A0ACC2G8X2_DALPE|nr:hypothetical protein DPEC_G00200950 [Dallia pectoralis]